jgi:hypothetical protein
MTTPTVEVRLTEEQKLLVPDWEKRTETFQRRCNQWSRNLEERFRICLHEGGHAVQYRKLGWRVEFQGPHVRFEDGDLCFVGGSVLPIPADFEPLLHWQEAMTSISSFFLVEHFTAVPDGPLAIQGDLKGLRSKLGENGDLNLAVYSAEIMLESQLSEPTFISELERAVRDYELAIYGTDEATTWGWREYHPELQGTRHRVSDVQRVLRNTGGERRRFETRGGRRGLPSRR